LRLLLLLVACSESGTGVLLTVDGPPVDKLAVTARGVTREVEVKRPLPATLLAELPDETAHISFDVVGFLSNARVGEGATDVDVTPHHIATATVHLSGASDGGAAGDLAPPVFTVHQTGQPGLLTGVWASASEVYVTSRLINGNNLLHSTGGGAFTGSRAAQKGDLNGVWGASPSSVFLVGAGGALLTGSGSSFTAQSTPAGSADLFGVWGTSAADVYVVGGGNTVLHSVAGGWVLQTPVGTTELHAVGGTAGSIYAVGSGGVILHSTGDGAWTPQTSNSGAGLWGVFAAGGSVWVAGDGGTILRSSGNGVWTPEAATGGLSAVWGSSAADLWAVGESALRSTGNGTWTALAVPARLTSVFGTGANDVWLVGDQQTILHHP
jgi:hypothetical protein